MNPKDTYLYYRGLFDNQRLPLAFVDLDKFDANVAYVTQLAHAAGKTIRLGSKSIRCVDLMRRIFAATSVPYDATVIDYGRAHHATKSFGDPTGVQAHERPVTDSIAKYAADLKSRPEVLQLARQIIDRLDAAHLVRWGYAKEHILDDVPFHGPGGQTVPPPDEGGPFLVGATGRSPDQPAASCGCRSKPPRRGPARPMLFAHKLLAPGPQLKHPGTVKPF